MKPVKTVTRSALGLFAALSAAMAVTACSGGDHEYIMGLRDGRMIVTKGKPALDDKTGMYTYRGQDGIRSSIVKDEVVQILER